MPDLQRIVAETMGDSLGGVPADFHMATAHLVLAAIEEAGYTVVADDEITRLRADLAALVEVAAGAVSDETVADPGVFRLMRYLAAHHPVETTHG